MTTSSDVKFILNIQSNKPPPERKDKEKKKKPDGMNRELFNLIGGPPTPAPVPVSKSNMKEVRPGVSQGTKWVLLLFRNPARTDSLELHHWQRESEANQPYPYAKLNKKVELVRYTQEEYEQCMEQVEDGWTKEETDILWGLCELYDLRFVVITDRYSSSGQPPRTLEELKHRYYSVSKAVLELRGEHNHPLLKKPYNYDYEVRRKTNLEKLFQRTVEHQNEERQLLESLKQIDQKIKKEEKDIRTLKTLIKKSGGTVPSASETQKVVFGRGSVHLNPELDPHSERGAQAEEKGAAVAGNDAEAEESDSAPNRGGRHDRGSEAYLRSEQLKAPLPISENAQRKLNQVLKELDIPPNLMPTAKVVKLYDRLRKEVLGLLSLEKHVAMKEKQQNDYQVRCKALIRDNPAQATPACKTHPQATAPEPLIAEPGLHPQQQSKEAPNKSVPEGGTTAEGKRHSTSKSRHSNAKIKIKLKLKAKSETKRKPSKKKAKHRKASTNKQSVKRKHQSRHSHRGSLQHHDEPPKPAANPPSLSLSLAAQAAVIASNEAVPISAPPAVIMPAPMPTAIQPDMPSIAPSVQPLSATPNLPSEPSVPSSSEVLPAPGNAAPAPPALSSIVSVNAKTNVGSKENAKRSTRRSKGTKKKQKKSSKRKAKQVTITAPDNQSPEEGSLPS